VSSFSRKISAARKFLSRIVVGRQLGGARSDGKSFKQCRERLVGCKSCRIAALDSVPCKDGVTLQLRSRANENKTVRGERNRASAAGMALESGCPE